MTCTAPAGADAWTRCFGRPAAGRWRSAPHSTTVARSRWWPTTRLFSNRALRETGGGAVRARTGRAAVRSRDRRRVPPRLRCLPIARRRHARLDAPVALGVGDPAARRRRGARAGGRRASGSGRSARGIERRRRSPLEHVRALATALAAARGHDVAVRSHRAGASAPALPRRAGPARGESSARGSTTSRRPSARRAAGRALDTLTTITRRPASADDVLSRGRRRGNTLGGADADMTADPIPLSPTRPRRTPRPRAGSSRRSTAWCWASRPPSARRSPRCSPAGTCCSKACPAPPRRCWSGRSAWRSASSSAASSSRRT